MRNSTHAKISVYARMHYDVATRKGSARSSSRIPTVYTGTDDEDDGSGEATASGEETGGGPMGGGPMGGGPMGRQLAGAESAMCEVYFYGFMTECPTIKGHNNDEDHFVPEEVINRIVFDESYVLSGEGLGSSGDACRNRSDIVKIGQHYRLYDTAGKEKVSYNHMSIWANVIEGERTRWRLRLRIVYPPLTLPCTHAHLRQVTASNGQAEKVMGSVSVWNIWQHIPWGVESNLTVAEMEASMVNGSTVYKGARHVAHGAGGVHQCWCWRV